jgi:hypothetical protein
MRPRAAAWPRLRTATILTGLTLLPACSGSSPAGPEVPSILLNFDSSSLDLGSDLQGATTLRNEGALSVGPVSLIASQLQLGGTAIPGVRAVVTPDEVPTLNPGSSAALSVRVEADGELQPGNYSARVDAIVAGLPEATLGLEFVVIAADEPGVALVEIIDPPTAARQGDVVGLTARARGEAGEVLEDVQFAWQVTPAGAGLVVGDGRFVGYVPGETQVTLRAGSAEASITIGVSPRGLQAGSYQLVGQGEQTTRFNADLWVHGDCAYTGTWGDKAGSLGNTLNAWDISNPATPTLSDAVTVDARVVNDVKVRSDGTLAAISHEFSLDQLNGVTLLDLSGPCGMSAISRFTSGLQSGVHNLWVEGDFLYVVADNVGAGLRVLDISDPASPHVVAAFADPASFLHDVYVRDGLAFLSHWDSGLIILDVGNGIAGGSPSSPAEVSRVLTSGGQTHNAWYWPEGGYVFVGEEDFGTPGRMHVVDVGDLRAPVEVASFVVPGDTPHNFWLDEANEILHMAWYTQGLVALDVSGELLGALDQQGRTLASMRYAGSGSCPGSVTGTCTWAPQLHEGLVYLADMNTGLWVLRPDF